MFTIFVSIPAALSLLYTLSLLYLRKGFSKIRKGTNAEILFVTIIIAARNEEKNIAACLSCVLSQNYPSESFEVIVIDDRSEDTTAEIVRHWQQKWSNLSLLQIRDQLPKQSPKKHAIALGIQVARGQIIFTTDADCSPGPNWLKQTVRQFEPEVGLVAGFNPYASSGLQNQFQKMLALDYFAMAAVAAAGSGLNFPLSCSGGNLAYRKSLFQQLGGFGKTAKVQSGDDDLFMERVRDETGCQIKYSISPDTFVPTLPPASLTEFMHQRFRYASKGALYNAKVVLGLVCVFCLNLLLVTGCFVVFMSPQFAEPIFGAFALKACAEFFFLKKACQSFQVKFETFTFVLAALIHPFYITVVAIGGQFGKYSWKDRQNGSKR